MGELATVPSTEKVGLFHRIGRTASILTTQSRQRLDERRMKKDLSRWFTAAKDFKANGLPPGSPAYQQLYQQSTARISDHASKWGVEPQKVVVELPGLYSLQLLTTPAKTRPSANPLAMLLGLLLLLFGGAAALGGAAGVFHLVERWLLR